MYTYCKNRETKYKGYDILDPDNIVICWVVSKTEAEALLSHLNRK